MKRTPGTVYDPSLVRMSEPLTIEAKSGKGLEKRIFRDINKLTMRDGSTLYECATCPGTAWPGWGSVRRHAGDLHPLPQTLAKRERRARLARQPARTPRSVAEPKPAARVAQVESALDTYVSSELELGVPPLPPREERRARRASKEARAEEADLDRMAPHAAQGLAELFDRFVVSRAAFQQDAAEHAAELAKVTAQRDQAVKVLRQMAVMIDTLIAGMEGSRNDSPPQGNQLPSGSANGRPNN